MMIMMLTFRIRICSYAYVGEEKRSFSSIHLSFIRWSPVNEIDKKDRYTREKQIETY